MWLSKENYLIYLFKKEWYHRAQYWVLFFFSIFINDLPLILSHCSVHLYAEDTVIYISNPHLTQIQNMLQSDLNALQEWLYSNNLLLNKGKSHTMIFGTKRMFKLKSNNIKITCNDGTYLHRVDQIKYLGLWLDPELSFKPHIDYILRKVNFGISVLYRSKKVFLLMFEKNLLCNLYYLSLTMLI